MRTTWTENEFKAYILLYCATIDNDKSWEEQELINTYVNDKDFVAIRREFEKDNDYQAIEKINHTLERLGYTKNDTERLIAEIKQLFLADGTFSATEKALFNGLKRILR
ncbi:hypothetical protein [Marinirhabdus gelatinilytica]|uniref:Tellurite resistance protein TerB n=1 Tax=Marinirhabdus gelatinilytica TaxID=1703343 RepID=A0A370QAG8_9FLAO|nr:hypothetical protein [Marinirhabdus gelatinilytica]RDK85368.1 hypothetical protein C8D94_103193 [Marinirhabdus gelatinilytica]